jgi:hypothetical protein
MSVEVVSFEFSGADRCENDGERNADSFVGTYVL